MHQPEALVPRVVAMTDIDLIDIVITDEDLRAIQRAFEAKLLQMEHPYVFDLIRVLARSRQGMKRSVALDVMRSDRARAGLPIPTSFDNTVQASMQYYCRDSDIFRNRNAPAEDALFDWPKGKGAGFWALVRENAGPWIRQNRETLVRRLAGN